MSLHFIDNVDLHLANLGQVMEISVLWNGRPLPNTLPAAYFCFGGDRKSHRGGNPDKACEAGSGCLCLFATGWSRVSVIFCRI